MEKMMALLMADLSGYTAMTEIHGAAAAAEIVEQYQQMAIRALGPSSRFLERVGDQLVIISEDPDDLARTAIKLEHFTRNEPGFLSIHAGLNFGPVLEQNGRLYGSTVNLTARIAARAGKGHILCSPDFVNALSDPLAFRFESLGKMRFKNILESRELFKLELPSQRKGKAFYIDPVCQMHIDAHEPHIIHKHERQILHFCSEDCQEIFLQYKMEEFGVAV